ncbi:hypothetical protein BAMA_03375 [Bacillus manliponensis]|uniref:FeS cluster biogenesis domain-containing protein n=1 Tax=Bacillus manliponensis TaxID=574376 RepID=A0A073JX20_9BACI|nr:HesB/YadR/YfhF family protein [Bacillus manliponensis]KEK18830.1 hypothetical protein BAMA_03375 [Bacillus manliponensis]
MNLSVSKEAANWYKEELLLQDGDFIRFFVQYGGCSTVQKGLSLGLRKDAPMNACAQTSESGITFFIEGDDEWYFDGHNLSVTFNEGDESPQFHYEK